MIDQKAVIRGLGDVAPQAKDMAMAMAKLAEDFGVSAEFEGTTGKGHQRVWFRWNGQARQMTFASTPSCGRAGKNNVSVARRLMSEMGVDTRTAKQKAADKTVLGSYTAPPPSQAYLDYAATHEHLRSTPRELIADRDEFIKGCMTESAKAKDIWFALTAAGWEVSQSAVYNRIHTFKKQGLAPAFDPPVDEPAEEPAQVPAALPATELPAADDFALALAEAIAPVIKKFIRREVVSMLREVSE